MKVFKVTTHLFCNFVFTKLFRFCDRKHPYPLYPRQSISDSNRIYTECYSESSQSKSGAIFRHKILHTFTSHINDALIHTLHSWYSRRFTDYYKSFLSHKQTVLENICTNVEMAVCDGRKGYVYLGDN